jgi:hypothetical protein
MKCHKDRNRIPPIMHELKDPCLAEKANLSEHYSDNSGLPTSMLFNARHYGTLTRIMELEICSDIVQ